MRLDTGCRLGGCSVRSSGSPASSSLLEAEPGKHMTAAPGRAASTVSGTSMSNGTTDPGSGYASHFSRR